MEAGVDCGAACSVGCAPGTPCSTYLDCSSLVCATQGASKQCAAPSCFDSVKNGGETDINCGGPCAQKCPPNYACVVDSDCIGGTCDPASKKCPPTCVDGYENGGETDVDCGGPCPNKCPLGWHCQAGSDCTTGNCVTLHCAP
jgi:hypothetical protein